MEKQHNLVLGEIYFDQQNSQTESTESKQKVNLPTNEMSEQ